MREALRSSELSRGTLSAGAAGVIAMEGAIGVNSDVFNPGIVKQAGGDIDKVTLGHSGNGGDLSAGYHTTGKQPELPEVSFN